jgi:hypothetical protein
LSFHEGGLNDLTFNINRWLARLRREFVPGKSNCGFYEEELYASFSAHFPQFVPVTVEYNIKVSKDSLLETFFKLFDGMGIVR